MQRALSEVDWYMQEKTGTKVSDSIRRHAKRSEEGKRSNRGEERMKFDACSPGTYTLSASLLFLSFLYLFLHSSMQILSLFVPKLLPHLVLQTLLNP